MSNPRRIVERAAALRWDVILYAGCSAFAAGLAATTKGLKASHTGDRASMTLRDHHDGPRGRDVMQLRWDAMIYAAFAVVAGGLAMFSQSATYQAWARIATAAYVAAAVIGVLQLVAARRGARMGVGPAGRGALAAAVWVATAVVPTLLFAIGRANGQHGRGQMDIRVLEAAGRRLSETGTPYLSRDAIAALPDDHLAAYVPYQPLMAAFGLPRAWDPAGAWWSDPRIWFGLATVVGLVAALAALRGATASSWVRAAQVVAALPNLSLATVASGHDAPVLAMCLVALALSARHRYGAAGVAAGIACACKLIAWPVAVVLAIHVVARGRSSAVRYGLGAVGVPVVTARSVFHVDAGAMLENTVVFLLGRGVVTSVAQSPLPGHLLATYVPGGKTIATLLLVALAAGFAARLVRRPPATVAAVATTSAYGLIAAMALMPASRFGYLLYPVVLLSWAPALRLHHARAPSDTGVQPATGPAAGWLGCRG